MAGRLANYLKSATLAATGGRRSTSQHGEEEDDETFSKPPLFALRSGYANYHVRLKDVKDYFAKQELKRKRRLGFQLEALFLFFFIPLCIFWNAAYGQVEDAAEQLAFSLFPISPIESTEAYRDSSFSDFTKGFRSTEEYWQWINNVLYDRVFVKGKCGLMVGENPNMLTVGMVRIRQVRVAPRACPAAASLMGIACYPAFTDAYESTRPISPEFPYQTSATTMEMPYNGKMAEYPGSGFTINLTTGVPPGTTCDVNNLTQATQLIDARTTPFLDRSTRAIIVTFSTFSPNTGVLVTTRMGTEQSYSGASVTTVQNVGTIFYRSQSSQLTMQVLTIFVTVLESVFIISSLWTIVFALKIDSRTWVLADLASSGLMIYQMYVSIGFFFTSDYTSQFENEINEFSNGEWSGSGFFSGMALKDLETLSSIHGALILLSAVRLFRYSQYFEFMGTIHGTIRKTFSDIVLYLLLLVLLSLGYVLCGVVVLGYNLDSFRSYGNAVYSVIEYYVLSIDYYSVSDMEPLGIYFAPLFLASFILIFTWYMFTVFVAIIYVGYRLERTWILKQQSDKSTWIRQAELAGAVCPIESEMLQPRNAVINEQEEGTGEATINGNNSNHNNGNDIPPSITGLTNSLPSTTTTVNTTRFGGILLRKNFYYSSWRSSLLEWTRDFFGLPERPGFKDYSTILLHLEEYEENLRHSLLSPSKRFYVSFSELTDIVNGRCSDLVEELRRTQNDAQAAEEYKRLRLGKVSDVEKRRYQEQLEQDADPDAYLTRMDPTEMQLTRVFRMLWVVPDDKVDLLARTEADDSGGLIKRSLLVRIEQSLGILDERETEANRLIINKIRSMRVVQQTMERDLKAMRDLLK